MSSLFSRWFNTKTNNSEIEEMADVEQTKQPGSKLLSFCYLSGNDASFNNYS